jgi:hypothetical protein
MGPIHRRCRDRTLPRMVDAAAIRPLSAPQIIRGTPQIRRFESSVHIGRGTAFARGVQRGGIIAPAVIDDVVRWIVEQKRSRQ